MSMEDIEDLMVGSGGAPPGFRLPISASVGVNPKKKKNHQTNFKNNSTIEGSLGAPQSPKIPGTEVISFSISVSLFVFM